MQQPSPWGDSQMYDLAVKPRLYLPVLLVLNSLPRKLVELQALIANAFAATMDAMTVKTDTSRTMVIICERDGAQSETKAKKHRLTA